MISENEVLAVITGAVRQLLTAEVAEQFKRGVERGKYEQSREWREEQDRLRARIAELEEEKARLVSSAFSKNG